jgi:hypothetical protein
MRENRARAYSVVLEPDYGQHHPFMATAKSITTDDYQLYPSPRNRQRTVFAHQVFVPYPYMLIDLEAYDFNGPYSLFAACRLSDGKMGQLVTLEREEDALRFTTRFVPD